MENISQIEARHRKENKELVARITALRKSDGGDKRRKRELQAEIAQLEFAQQQRHASELAAASGDGPQRDASGQDATEKDQEAPVRKMGRQQMRKARKEAAFEADRAAAEEEARKGPNLKAQELAEITRQLAARGLQLVDIPADGHCLYNAVAHQLAAAGQLPKTAAQMRQLAAAHLRAHADEMRPFVAGADGEMCTADEFAAYCDAIVATPVWGGDIELQALAQALQTPIEVVQASAAPRTYGDEGSAKPLRVSYHRHYYGLGAHYNSLVPL